MMWPWSRAGHRLGEALLDGLVREVEEETGLHVEPRPPVGRAQEPAPRGRGLGISPHPRRRAADHDRREVAWLTRAEVSEYMDEAYAVRMLDALDDGHPR